MNKKDIKNRNIEELMSLLLDKGILEKDKLKINRMVYRKLNNDSNMIKRTMAVKQFTIMVFPMFFSPVTIHNAPHTTPNRTMTPSIEKINSTIVFFPPYRDRDIDSSSLSQLFIPPIILCDAQHLLYKGCSSNAIYFFI